MGKLSARERTVAKRVANGEALKAIAASCAISVQAVSTYLERAKTKLGVTSRAELVRALHGIDALEASSKLTEILTLAELEILDGILQGLRNGQIARARGRSVHTVASQASTVMRKLGASSRFEVIARVAGKQL